jgi:copper homeostasis protein
MYGYFLDLQIFGCIFALYFYKLFLYLYKMNTFETELCAYSVEAVRTAVEEGVTRVELCASFFEGGLTPSAATIRAAREAAYSEWMTGAEDDDFPVDSDRGQTVELSVMIRPRGGDFLYSDEEFEVMKRDIAFARECGADGVVFGILTPDGAVDVERTRKLVESAGSMECTFHRAFDVAADPMRALEDIIATGCSRILTSGQRATAMEGIETIRAMVAQAAGRIEIMAGAGVNPGNAVELIAAGVDALHFSARAMRESKMAYRSPYVSFSPVGGSDYELMYADPAFVRRMVEIAE